MSRNPMNRWSRDPQRSEETVRETNRRDKAGPGAMRPHDWTDRWEGSYRGPISGERSTHTGAMPSSGGDDRTGDYVGYGLPYEHERPGRGNAPGKPPKNYARSDERIHDEICEWLADHGADWSAVEVSVTSGEVTLSGTVPTRRLKLEAEHIVDGVRGVKDITNQIRVQRGENP